VITQYKQTKSEFGQLIGMEMPELTLEIPILSTDLGEICLISYKLISFTLMIITSYHFLKKAAFGTKYTKTSIDSEKCIVL